MKSNNSPINNKGKKNFSPPIKIGKTKHVWGKTVLGKNLGGGENKDTQTKLKRKLSRGYT